LLSIFIGDIRSFAVSHREESAMTMICKLVIASVTFLVFFYSTTFAMSLMYGLDSALLRF
jgi:hypothetical protein